MREFLDRAYDSDHHLEAICWHDPSDALAEKELALGIDTDTPDEIDVLALRKIPADALLVLLRFIVGDSSKPRHRWRIAQLRLAVLAHAAALDGVGNKTLTSLASELQCTKALLSIYATRLADQLGESQVRGGKSRAARETYRQRAIEVHERMGHTIHTPSPDVALTE